MQRATKLLHFCWGIKAHWLLEHGQKKQGPLHTTLIKVWHCLCIPSSPVHWSFSGFHFYVCLSKILFLVKETQTCSYLIRKPIFPTTIILLPLHLLALTDPCYLICTTEPKHNLFSSYYGAFFCKQKRTRLFHILKTYLLHNLVAKASHCVECY